MRIENPGAQPLPHTGQTAPADQGRRPAPRSTAAAGDAVDLSRLSAAVAALGAASPQRRERVDALESAVQAGEYRTDSRLTSAALVREALGEAA